MSAKHVKRAAPKRKAAKTKKWVYLTVPVVEGEQYTLGEITFTGNEKFEDSALRTQIPLKSGEVLKNNLLDLGIDFSDGQNLLRPAAPLLALDADPRLSSRVTAENVHASLRLTGPAVLLGADEPGAPELEAKVFEVLPIGERWEG